MVASIAPAADEFKPDTTRGDAMLAEYFDHEVSILERQCLDEATLNTWKDQREHYRKQLLEMLGLDPLPERTDLHATITGKVEHDEFTVEKLHYQSRPGLYVTANLYMPKGLDAPAPAILYVCGHSKQVKDGVSYGNKTGYQHHGEWFARHGYVCLTIDTLQLGEIQGIHHGTYRYDRWWWNARGYTPAGVEAWNAMRGIDYLQSRVEVDGERIGIAGRSGGGAYSWWTAAIDPRVKAAAPTAGITDLRNHVVAGYPWSRADGVVEGHCDCMFDVNTYRWDYPMVAALVAPRALLIENTDKDTIFPLDGVIRTYEKVRSVYELYGARNKLGLHLTEGPHSDTQRLRVGEFEWFERHLKGNKNAVIDTPAEKLFDSEQLRVFEPGAEPADAINATADETFTVKTGPPTVPADAPQWAAMRDGWIKALREKSFAGWPAEGESLDVKPVFDAVHDGVRFRAYDFTSQDTVRLRLYVAQQGDAETVTLRAVDDDGWREFLAAMRVGFSEQLKDETLPAADQAGWQQFKQSLAKGQVMVWVAPRGVGPTAWNWDKKKRTHIRRRFMLLGQTLDGQRVFDICRAVAALRTIEALGQLPLTLNGRGTMAGNVLYASLFVDDVAGLDLHTLPASHRTGPIYLNVLRFMDMPAAVAMATERCGVQLHDTAADDATYAQQVAKKLNWPAQTVLIEP
ncbi:prolyl oligopeptidase family serine peptidase [Planctomycetales bacterium ZRK34]|nr:prolyl oligopeptidase family serine peptidase [Planctomycetales bacterium ZRK34]